MTAASCLVLRLTPAQAGDDATVTQWVPLSEAVGLAFDHDEITRAATQNRTR